MPLRWINPDEGAHLLDAHLLLQGLWPVADFSSRQPFYVALLALFVGIGGRHFWIGRLLPMFSSLATAAVLYFFCKMLFDKRTGKIAAVLWLFLPLNLIWATVVKTEPLTILLGLVSMYLLAKNLKEGRPALLVISGAAAALAFYVRQPALYLPLSAAIFLFFNPKPLKNVALYAAGYLAVVAAVFAVFSLRMTPVEILFSQLNPTTLILSRLFHLLGKAPEALRIADEGGFRILSQSPDETLLAWRHALSFSALVLLPAMGVLIRPSFRRSPINVRLFCGIWMGVVTALYLFQSAHRGYYSQYFTEALPPLVILTARAFNDNGLWKLGSFKKLMGIAVAVFMLLAVGAKICSLYSLNLIKSYLIIAVVLAAIVFYFVRHHRIYSGSFKKTTAVYGLILLILLLEAAGREMQWNSESFMIYIFNMVFIFALILIANEAPLLNLSLFGFFLTAITSGMVLGPRYESVWSPQTLKECTAVLRREGSKDDQVLSGAGIWTFEAGLRPFLNSPHPTEFQLKKRADFERIFLAKPPAFIVVDGYTERKFNRYWDFLQERMAIDYERVAGFTDSKYPVQVYRYRGNGKPLPALISGVLH
ncbi:MAG: glycosyltransferase family 39 protein [candidate division KSB1 bacterium]|nr:glycosyltransferase family 39 protein [candidate division KSB1 bacterium]